jgi:cytoskeletal protein RodZ
VLFRSESVNYGEIPDKVYTKSFLKIYSEFLGLDRVYIVRRYLDEITQEDPIIAPKTYNQHHFGERNYPGEKTSYNRLVYIFAGLLIIAVLVWGVYWILSVKNNRLGKVAENTVNLSDVQEKKTEEIPSTPPVIPIPEQEIAPKHSYDKLLVDIKTTERVWVGITLDRTKSDQYTLNANITKSIEAARNISLTFGKAGAVSLTINGFEISKLGNLDETIDLDITLSPGESIQVVTVRGNKSETQILKE